MLSILEREIYLREQDYRNIEIAEMLGKDSRNVWTIWNRARRKAIRQEMDKDARRFL